MIVHAKFMACHVHKIPCFRELLCKAQQGSPPCCAFQPPEIRGYGQFLQQPPPDPMELLEVWKFEWKFEVWKSIMWIRRSCCRSDATVELHKCANDNPMTTTAQKRGPWRLEPSHVYCFCPWHETIVVWGENWHCLYSTGPKWHEMPLQVVNQVTRSAAVSSRHAAVARCSETHGLRLTSSLSSSSTCAVWRVATAKEISPWAIHVAAFWCFLHKRQVLVSGCKTSTTNFIWCPNPKGSALSTQYVFPPFWSMKVFLRPPPAAWTSPSEQARQKAWGHAMKQEAQLANGE